MLDVTIFDTTRDYSIETDESNTDRVSAISIDHRIPISILIILELLCKEPDVRVTELRTEDECKMLRTAPKVINKKLTLR